MSLEHGVISLPRHSFEDLATCLNLSFRQLEAGNTFGPFIWSVTCTEGGRDHLRRHSRSKREIFGLKLAVLMGIELIYRSIHGNKVGHCQGWELSLAYFPQSRQTTGFFSRDFKCTVEQMDHAFETA